MYLNVIKACRNAEQYELAQRIFREYRLMIRPRTETVHDVAGPSSGDTPLILRVEPMAFCEMMIIMKELDRPHGVLDLAADLYGLYFPPDVRTQRRQRKGKKFDSPALCSANVMSGFAVNDEEGNRVLDAAADARVLRLLCAAKFQLKQWGEVDALCDVMFSRGLEPTRLVYNLGLSANIRLNNPARALSLFERMLLKCPQPPSEVSPLLLPC